MMWGSDWPVCELTCSYDEWRGATDSLLVRLSVTEREYILSETARATYGI
jgi:L-fuconolactonase